tara:strand:+ start:574 stop:729 length:156 start_codon:yes stop_codon:yes gene_type:complete
MTLNSALISSVAHVATSAIISSIVLSSMRGSQPLTCFSDQANTATRSAATC